MRTWLAYGSLKPDDLVRRADEEEWFPVRLFPEFSSIFSPPEGEPKSGLWKSPRPSAPAQPTTRFRKFQYVPEEQRSGNVIRRLLSGFIWRPITFWSTAATVFTSKIYRNSKDEAGFLTTWPRWVEIPLTLLILLHAVMWTSAAFWVVPRANMVKNTIVESVHDVMQEATAELPPAAATK